MATFTISDAAGTAVPPNPQVLGTLKAVVCQIAVSGNYTDEGDSLPPERFGLDKIVLFLADLGAASDGETAVAVRYDYTNEKLLMFESGASGAAFAEKTASEAVPTGMSFRAVVFGY